MPVTGRLDLLTAELGARAIRLWHILLSGDHMPLHFLTTSATPTPIQISTLRKNTNNIHQLKTRQLSIHRTPNSLSVVHHLPKNGIQSVQSKACASKWSLRMVTHSSMLRYRQ